LHGKLQNAGQLVTKASSYLETKNSDAKAKELLSALKSLKLEEVEVDVTSTKMELHDELSRLRSVVEGNGPPPAAAFTPAASAPPLATMSHADTGKMKGLETENAKLLQQIAELKNELSTATETVSQHQQSSQHLAKHQQQSSQNQEEINKLKKEIDQLNSKSKETTQQKDSEISDLNDQLKAINLKFSSSSSQEKQLETEIETLKGQLKEEKHSKQVSLKESESKAHAKLQETIASYENKLKESEATWSQEREEMEVALAQELEEVEKGKDEEIQSLMNENSILTKQFKQLQMTNANLFNNLRKLREKSKNLKTEFSRNFNSSIQDEISDVKRLVASGAMILTKLKNMSAEFQTLNKKYLRECSERKRLHNVVQELKGNIRVYLRCRPPTNKEIENFGNDSLCVSFPNPGEIKVFNSEKNREKVWEFDEVFDTNTTQDQVYQDVSALVTSVLDGYNVCIFAYGQTGKSVFCFSCFFFFLMNVVSTNQKAPERLTPWQDLPLIEV
jgi:DNA repair exonuclease SbcCD ATPase subunit